MGYKFNPFTGTLDTVDSPNGVFEELDVNGDIVLDDGGTYTTTVQVVTPTANRTISFPDATGTVGLVAGSSGQLVYNAAGAYAGVPSSVIGATGDITLTLNGAASTPPLDVTGTWFTGGTSTTTKPQVLIEPAGTTSTAWSTSGTGLGVNAASGFAGNLLDLQVNGTSRVVATNAGRLGVGTNSPSQPLHVAGSTTYQGILVNGNAAPTIGFDTSTLTAIKWKVGLSGNNSNNFSISAGAANDDKLTIKSTGIVNLSNAPTYADNTAALAGGLVAGDVYKTSAGDLRITV